MFADGYNAKLAEAKDTNPAGAATPSYSPRPYTLSELAAKTAQDHQVLADQHKAAALFFSRHPEFEEFIKLVRSGAIHF